MISNSHIVALECLEIAVKALEEVAELATLEDYELIQVKCAEADLEIKRKQALGV